MEVTSSRQWTIVELTIKMTQEEAAAFKGIFGRISPISRWAEATTPEEIANTVAAKIAAGIPDLHGDRT
jgi:hypothetical protein